MKLLLLLAIASAQPGPMPAGVSDFLARCADTGQRLWGRSMCAPVVVVDPATGAYRSSRPPPAPLPPLRANTAFDWAGETWIMVLEPLPADPAELAALLFHEAWHVHQGALGFPANMAVAAHLDDPVPRYLLRLEWAALERSLAAQGAERERHIGQALAFRARRIGGDTGAAEAERAQMLHEGLAAYAGTAASGAPERLALEALRGGSGRAGLGRSFAYVSGPAWGLLLDRVRPGWRAWVGASDLPDLIGIPPARLARADDYDGTRILAEETAAALDRRTRLEAALAATDERRALRLPLARMNMDFDPNRVSSAPDGSTIYHRITLSDRWGRIAVEGTGLRIATDFSAAFAPWPLPDGTLRLEEGWRAVPRPGGGAELVRED